MVSNFHTGLECTVINYNQTHNRRPFNFTRIAAGFGVVLILYSYIPMLPVLLTMAMPIFVGLIQVWIGFAVLTFIVFRRPPTFPLAIILRTTVSLICKTVAAVTRMLFPGGEVRTFQYRLRAIQTGEEVFALIYGPDGVPPEAGTRVLVQGHHRRHYFAANRIVCVAGAGTPRQRPHGLIARQDPPVLLAVALLTVGLVLNMS